MAETLFDLDRLSMYRLTVEYTTGSKQAATVQAKAQGQLLFGGRG